MGYIGHHGVATLRRYKYSGVDHSLVAKYILQPFWSRFVNIFPLWFPPNMITLTGFMFLLTSAFLGFLYSPHLDIAPPRWVHLAHGLLLFLYQTFDAVDGKQARRTYVWKGYLLVVVHFSLYHFTSQPGNSIIWLKNFMLQKRT